MIDVDEVYEKLKTVFDPEIGVNIVDLGLIYEVNEPAEGDLVIRMTMTTPGCPVHDHISQAVERAAAQAFGVGSIRVDVVWDPPWTPDRMSEEARKQLYF